MRTTNPEGGLLNETRVPGDNDDDRGAPEKSQTADRSPRQWAVYWKEQITLAEREHKPYWADCALVADRYRNALKGTTKKRARFNVLYANVETLKGAIYAKSGKPDVRPRWSTEDKIARTASELIERSLVTSIDTRAHETAVGGTVLTGILAGRGVMRIDLESMLGEVEMPTPVSEAGMQGMPAMPMGMAPPPMGDNGGPPMQEQVIEQKIIKSFIRTNDFLHNPANDWSEVWWVAYRVRMTREDMRDNGFEGADTIELNWAPRNEKGEIDTRASDDVKRAEFWEVWSKAQKKRYWVHMNHDRVVRIDDDPYGLGGFFNCPEPMAFHTSGSMIPFLEFFQYETLADDLEEMHNRIAALTRALKRRGVRDKAIKGLEKLARANDNEFVDVDSWQQLVQKGGLKGVFETEDIQPIAAVLVQLIQIAQAVEGKIDRITGIADIMRGASEGGAKTATEQQIKAQYGGVRIKGKQREVERYLRDTMRIEAELIAEHFEPRTLQEMTGIQVPPEVMQMLRSDRARGMRIDVETDSTVFEDAAAEKEAVTEAVNTAMTLVEKGVMAIQQAPEFAEVIFESLGLLLRHIKGGRTMQDVVERAKTAMMQRLQKQSQQPPPPDPEQIKAQAAMQQAQMKQQADQAATQAKMQADQQTQAAKMQADAQAAQAKLQADMAMEEQKARVAMQVEQLKAEVMQAVEAQRLQQQAQIEMMKLEFEQAKHQAEMALKEADLRIKEFEAQERASLAKTKADNDNAHREADRAMKDEHAAMHAEAKKKITEAAE